MNDLRMHESGSEYVYELDVPTAEADTLVAEVRDACVTVSGGVDRDPEFFGKSGRTPSVFSRRIVLPVDADLCQVRAVLNDGVLELHAPKYGHVPRRLVLERRS